ncbi:hypothetical protein ANANG_G00180840 [Anguilla anguilla]|uniref:Uncharacterized protein n=1 Tax=Anguilla anguilla TaxID=7936 RepID=A0A9D3M8D8_ANGAN|nr:hypothetical protein ANANG_G00180840 [Anguilla anguilla]
MAQAFSEHVCVFVCVWCVCVCVCVCVHVCVCACILLSPLESIPEIPTAQQLIWIGLQLSGTCLVIQAPPPFRLTDHKPTIPHFGMSLGVSLVFTTARNPMSPLDK